MSTLRVNVNVSTTASMPTPTPMNTPVRHTCDDDDVELPLPTDYSVENAIQNAGYIPLSQMDDTLQGQIWKVSQDSTTYVIKVTNKSLHDEGATYYSGQKLKISENILKEKAILEYLTEYSPPASLVQYTDFFSDDLNYFLVMQYAGKMSLFEFVKRCHQYIEQGIISLKQWHRLCRVALKQMVELLDWLHNTMHCCHLDLSLENFVIDNVMVTQRQRSKQIVFSSDFQIKLIDFGVSRVFCDTDKHNQIDFTSTKYVGKKAYKSPEVYAQKPFDARAADCWSLAVVFFMMIAGCPPWTKASKSDAAYKAMTQGHLAELLLQWNRLDYVTSDILDLMHRLFQKEEHRMRVEEIKMHPFLQ
eukprot:1701_1